MCIRDSDNGAYNLDKVNDAINEVTTRIADGTIADSMSAINEKTGELEEGSGKWSQSVEDVFKQWQEGGATQKQVIDAIVQDIQGTENQQDKLNKAALAFGTMAEDGSMKFISALTTVGDSYTCLLYTSSQEVIDDAEYDVTGLIRDEIQSQSLNTSNADIAAKLKTATAKSVVGIDGLKDLVNKGIKKVYPVKFIISASLYAELDKLKDKNGRYLLQDSIIAASGKTLLGREVIVLDDDMIGSKAGDLVGFVGDAKSFMAFFDRKRTSVEWVDNQIYGKLLAGIVRYDVQVTDTEAGCYITYTNETPTEGA